MSLFSYTFFSLFLFALVGNAVASFNPSSYPNSHVVPSPVDYTIYWRMDFENNHIFLALKAKTTGWVGFGIAEITSGSMPGADIMIGYYDKTKSHVDDRHSLARVTPVLDECQDVTLISAEENEGYTILEVRRSINTSDPQDRSIVSGPNRVIVAYGDSDDVIYHNANRKTDEITFFGSPLYTASTDDVANELTKDLRIADFVVPDAATVYACQTFEMPQDKEYTITQIDPIVNEANIAHVHHFLAHVCLNESSSPPSLVDKYQKPGTCSTPLGQISKGCIGIMSAWAAGGGPTFTPKEAGFPMGIKSTAIKYIILEIHYNNPDGKGGYTDNSGIKIHYSTTPRQYEADVITLGDPFTKFGAIPADTEATEYETECNSDCTQKFDHDINIFQSFPHMHEVGSKIWTTQWRDGNKIDELGRVEFWAFDHQTSQEVNVTIKKGDRLNTHCVYNTKGIKDRNVTFGIASTQEMCMHFLSYYPRLLTPSGVPYSFCGRYSAKSSICGAASQDNLYAIQNPLHFDPPGGANRTFGADSSVCQAQLETHNNSSSSLFASIGFIFVLGLVSVLCF